MNKLIAYFELMKTRPTALACLAVFFGFFAAGWPPSDPAALAAVIAGMFFTGGGAAALNQYFERDCDARMKRTLGRPIQTGGVTAQEAAVFGTLASAAGVACLFFYVNVLTALLGIIMAVLYVCVYTPLKRITPHSIWIGAVAGALPPVLGWAASGGVLGVGALVLFMILFFWQIPHVLAISWVHRADYERGGLFTFASEDRDGRRTVRGILCFLTALLTVSLLPVLAGMSGAVYACGAFLLGMVFVAFGLRLTPEGLDRSGKRYILGSVAYLPALIFFWIADYYL